MDQLFKETEETFFLYLTNVKNACLSITNNLRSDNIGEALQLIKQFVEGVSWVINVVELMKKNGYSFNITIEDLNEFLLEVNDGLEIQDFVLVADLFEYEIAPFIEKVQEGKFLEVKN